MRRWSTLNLLLFVLLLASGCADLNSPTINYPGISMTAITPTTITLAWNLALDGRTTQKSLVYSVYLSGPNPTYKSFNTLAEVEAGTLAATLTDGSSTTITGLTPGNSYYFNVVVQDKAGNKAVYSSLGEYFHSNQIAYYPFSGNTYDVMSGQNHLVVAGGASLPTSTLDRYGHANSAYSFNPAASTQCLQSTSAVGISGNASRTVSIWVESANTPAGTERVPFAWGDGSGSGSNFGMYETGIGSNWVVWLLNGTDVSTAAAVTNAWEHWVIGYDSATNSVYTYKNGAAVNSGTVPAGTVNTVDSLFHVGCGLDPIGTLAHPYQGSIDDLRIFNSLLTGANVTNLYNVTRP